MKYYVNNNAQSNGDREVHRSDCIYLPSDKNDLGEFSNCSDAVKEAKKTYSKFNGCKTCSNARHTT